MRDAGWPGNGDGTRWDKEKVVRDTHTWAARDWKVCKYTISANVH
jgi:hypothetical protein